MKAYCVKCKAKREMKNPKEVTLKNKRKAMKGTCPKCGTGMFMILGGSGGVKKKAKKVKKAKKTAKRAKKRVVRKKVVRKAKRKVSRRRSVKRKVAKKKTAKRRRRK